MTTNVTVECTRCGTTHAVPVDALLVALAETGDPAQDADLAAHVSWLCGQCADLVDIPIDWTALLVLVTEGAALLTLDDDEETLLPPHPEAPTSGPAFTADDLLELHELLATDSWFATFAADGTRP